MNQPRNDIWTQIEEQSFDIIVIGGGITGAGIFREAARAGLRTLLVDGSDFASGASSRSSKLVHGGLRYLRQGQFKTTLSSVKERERLLRQGKGLITPLGFLYAFFEGDKVPPWLLGLGLAVYDLLGLKWGHRYYKAADFQKLCPPLTLEGLRGGYRYFDALTDDARLTLRVLQEGIASGGLALNYALVEGLLRRRQGGVSGVVVRDNAPEGEGRVCEVEAALVINAGGAWADTLRQMAGGTARFRRLRGSHLVFAAEKLPIPRAIGFPHPVDQRAVFALPWEGATLFGTTDVDHEQPADQEPAIAPAEVDYLLTALRRAFPQSNLTEADIQTTFAGIRTVVNTGKANPSQESREHVLWLENGLLTVAGGKLTTFRAMARDALHSARRLLPGRPSFKTQRALDPPPAELEGLMAIEATARWRLLGRYGAAAPSLWAAAKTDEFSPIGDSPILWAELRWAARAEAVVHLDDLLLRRTRAGLLLPQGGEPWLERIRQIVQPELCWSDERWAAEADAYRRRWQKAYPSGDFL